ncbi:MAG TPA: NADPH-dependent 2,4-dienoyl-CoA reductase [Amycolatopsis sp.]|nr:NADPH-dependent 2,4-dienoyl-CoA reductase [Amycolatopsis sp.]
MTSHPRLLAPLTVGSRTLRNRIVMGAMHTRIETLDNPTERLVAFYAERARGEAALILTNGYSPDIAGRLEADSEVFDNTTDLAPHRAITQAVHDAGGLIALQILHAGRYAKHPYAVGPSDQRARINPIEPHALSTSEVWDTIDAFARTAELAKQAGYDGVEIMGSEGYLINEFLAEATNHTRDDEFGGTFEGRCRLPLEILRASRARVGSDFLLIYRISAIDLVEDGLSGKEIAELARQVEAAGADLINTGIGWHESAVPTIAASIPRGVWTFAARHVKDAVSIPVIVSNRINDPDLAEQVLADGAGDLVSMARPLLADPQFARKVRTGDIAEINTCIGCNQACLDRIFTDRTASCMVNPRAGHEIEFTRRDPATRKRIAVVGAGPAGMSFAVEAAELGHTVTLFEAAPQLGGQLNMARVVPGKDEFNQLLRYFRVRLDRLGVDVRLNTRADADQLAGEGFDEIVLATGVTPRVPEIKGVDHPMVMSYVDVLTGARRAGERVAIIGAGGIGYDVAEYLLGHPEESLDADAFLTAWSIDPTLSTPGGLTGPPRAEVPKPAREVTLLQRKTTRPGAGLGKSTGWILKARLRAAGLTTVAGATYEEISDQGLHYRVGDRTTVLEVDTVILCAGQESERDLYQQLTERNIPAHLIGGADLAAELDAVRAIDQAARLAQVV